MSQKISKHFYNGKTPLISIIIPCYNSEKYIAETLESVIEQTYKHWECIIVDDHSTDHTWNILEDYQRQHPTKIFLYKNPRKGACAARNTATERSIGSYLKFLDSDDMFYDKNSLEIYLKTSQKTGHYIIHGREVHFKSDDVSLRRGGKIKNYKDFTYNFPITSNLFISSDIGKKYKWNEILKNNQEFFYLTEIFNDNHPFTFLNIELIKIRQHDSIHRITNLDSYKRIDYFLLYIKEFYDKFLLNNNNPDKARNNEYINYIRSSLIKYYKISIFDVEYYKSDIILNTLKQYDLLTNLSSTKCFIIENFPKTYQTLDTTYKFFYYFFKNQISKIKNV